MYPVEAQASEVKVGVILLAAGASTRMGEPKQLLHLGSSTLLRRAAEAACDSVCRPVIVVVGAHSPRTRAELNDFPVIIIENHKWAEGMGGSIRAGIASLTASAADATGVIIMVCDQPHVTAAIINRLADEHRRTGARIVASEYGGNCGVPALFSREMFAELAPLDGAGGAKQIINANSQAVLRIPFAEGEIDIDTPEDYERLTIRIFGGEESGGSEEGGESSAR